MIITLPAALLEATPDLTSTGGTSGGRAAASPQPSRPVVAPPVRSAPRVGIDAPKAGDRRTFSDAEVARQAAIDRHLAEKGVTKCPTVAVNPVAGGIAVPEAERAVIRRHDAEQDLANKPHHARHNMAAKAARDEAKARKAGMR